MPKAIRLHAHGGPEVLTYEDADPGKPGVGQILIRHTAIGLNFIDVYHRSGLYPPPGGFPLIPGSEAAGVVLEVGGGIDWLKPGDTILFHAAAGGVGLILGQWAKHLGATVIGTASSTDKIELAKAHGFDHVINYKEQDFVAGVAAITGGRKCDVVYDS